MLETIGKIVLQNQINQFSVIINNNNYNIQYIPTYVYIFMIITLKKKLYFSQSKAISEDFNQAKKYIQFNNYLLT